MSLTNVYPVENLLGMFVMNVSPPGVQCATINGINILVDEVIPLRCDFNFITMYKFIISGTAIQGTVSRREDGSVYFRI